MAFLPRLKCAILCLHALHAIAAVVGADDPPAKRTRINARFVNQLPNTAIDVYWENHPDKDRKLETTLKPRGGWKDIKTFTGHEFSYVIDGTRYNITIGSGDEFGETFMLLVGLTEEFLVTCDVSVNSRKGMDRLEILVKPYWAERAASHFLELVREGYYDGVVFHRVVPNFLTQFGIARDYDLRTRGRERPIRDDHGDRIEFKPGYLSFAGNGVNSRTTEIFVVNPGVSESELGSFGENSWETPFGFIVGDVNASAITKIYSGYGDMVPFGNGPDSERIYDVDGYTTYIPHDFLKLDFIDRCYIVNEVLLDHAMSQGEL